MCIRDRYTTAHSRSSIVRREPGVNFCRPFWMAAMPLDADTSVVITASDATKAVSYTHLVTLGLLWLLKAQTWIPDGKAILMTVFLSGITPVCSALNSMVQLYDRDMEESGALYVLTTLLSIVTMPMVIAVFERVI